jgi:YggT family protein
MMLNVYLIMFLSFLNYGLTVYTYVFLVYFLLSFFPINENFILIRIIRGICEPPYKMVLRILPPLRIGMIDLSPIYIFILIQVLQFIISAIAHQISR